jgi:signal transduction histidine kinase
MGLGLTIVWRVLNSLRGTITVQSQPQPGTEFVVSLPRMKTAHSWVPADTNAARRPASPTAS